MGSYRRMSFVLVAAILAGYGTVALLGPQGFFSLRDRYTEIRRLERENADLNRGNRELESLIKKVRESRSQQEVLVKDKLKYTHTNETQFVLPDSGKPQQPSEPASK